MSAVSLPNKPAWDPNMSDTQMIKYQEDMQRYNRILTMITQTNSEEATTKANMDKARHDAIMAIASNLK